MVNALSEGQGVCRCENQITFRIRKSPLLMGAGPDAAAAAFRAVHRANRRSPADDRVAISLPDLNGARGFAGVGDVVRVFGTAAALARVSEELSQLREHRLFEVSDVSPVSAPAGSPGTAFVRSRSGEKSSEAGIERSRRRFGQRHAEDGKPWKERRRSKGRFDRSGVFIRLSEVRLQISVQGRPFTGTVLVNTYGLSPSTADAGLPLVLEALE